MENEFVTAASAIRQRPKRVFSLEMVLFTIVVISGIVLTWTILGPQNNIGMMIAAGTVFTLSLVAVIRLLLDPDSVRARQTDSMLQLASFTFENTTEGLSLKSSQRICNALLPTTAAIAVAITDRERIIGYAGFQEAENPVGSPIRTQATHDSIEDGEMRILESAEDIGFTGGSSTINAAIIVPLVVGKRVEGTLKFYYRKAKYITETQRSIAQGFGQLLSTQMAAAALEEQTKVATAMELKALQSQINPHFLFNTINTIASLIRTDPDNARTLLREFAVFYRRTLENSADLIPLSRELEQTERYFRFEVARFGADRVKLELDCAPRVRDMYVPSFLIQPLVENAVRHGRPTEGQLVVRIVGEDCGDDAVIKVIDNGNGMTEEARQNILHPESSTGCGVAVKNVHDRMRSCFGIESGMDVESKLDCGTTVTLTMVGALAADAQPSAESMPAR